MSSLDRAAALLSDVVARTGPLAPVILFGASFIEYVFPPFPGDTIVLLGAWYAVHGALSWPTAFAAVTLGAVLGAWFGWRVGRALAPALESRAAARASDEPAGCRDRSDREHRGHEIRRHAIGEPRDRGFAALRVLDGARDPRERGVAARARDAHA